MRRLFVSLFAAAMLSAPMVATPAPAAAQNQDADGLVVVQIGNVKDVVDLTAAVGLIVQACDLVDADRVNVLNILNIIDQEGGSENFCKNEAGQNVKAKNNNARNGG